MIVVADSYEQTQAEVTSRISTYLLVLGEYEAFPLDVYKSA